MVSNNGELSTVEKTGVNVIDAIAEANPYMVRLSDHNHETAIDVREITRVNIQTHATARQEGRSGTVMISIGLRGENGPMNFDLDEAGLKAFEQSYRTAMEKVEQARQQGFANRVGGNGVAQGRS